jgi:uncharacterized membrane protein
MVCGVIFFVMGGRSFLDLEKRKAQPIFVDCALVFLIIDRSGLYRTVCTVKTRLKSQSRPYRSL